MELLARPGYLGRTARARCPSLKSDGSCLLMWPLTWLLERRDPKGGRWLFGYPLSIDRAAARAVGARTWRNVMSGRFLVLGCRSEREGRRQVMWVYGNMGIKQEGRWVDTERKERSAICCINVRKLKSKLVHVIRGFTRSARMRSKQPEEGNPGHVDMTSIPSWTIMHLCLTSAHDPIRHIQPVNRPPASCPTSHPLDGRNRR